MLKAGALFPMYVQLNMANILKKPRPRAKFSREEDDHLRKLVHEYGENSWSVIAEHMPGRNIRQCKERWGTYLSPSLNNGPYTEQEDALLLRKYEELGAKWVKIAKFFEGRTDTSVKNRFIVLQRKKKSAQTNIPPPPPPVNTYSEEEFFDPYSDSKPMEDEESMLRADLWDEMIGRCEMDWM